MSKYRPFPICGITVILKSNRWLLEMSNKEALWETNMLTKPFFVFFVCFCHSHQN